MKKRALGTHEIAELCQVTPPTVGRWIGEGKLPSFMTAGGHHRVWSDDLLPFLQSLNIPIPPELEASVALKIVIVEDEPHVRDFIYKVLKTAYPRATIFKTSNGFEAGQTIATVIPSLVVLDIKLPGLDGIRVCHLLKSNEKLKDLKILVVSGRLHKDGNKQALRAGADDFMPKPFEPAEFIQRVKKLLGDLHGV